MPLLLAREHLSPLSWPLKATPDLQKGDPITGRLGSNVRLIHGGPPMMDRVRDKRGKGLGGQCRQ